MGLLPYRQGGWATSRKLETGPLLLQQGAPAPVSPHFWRKAHNQHRHQNFVQEVSCKKKVVLKKNKLSGVTIHLCNRHVTLRALLLTFITEKSSVKIWIFGCTLRSTVGKGNDKTDFQRNSRRRGEANDTFNLLAMKIVAFCVLQNWALPCLERVFFFH